MLLVAGEPGELVLDVARLQAGLTEQRAQARTDRMRVRSDLRDLDHVVLVLGVLARGLAALDRVDEQQDDHDREGDQADQAQ